MYIPSHVQSRIDDFLWQLKNVRVKHKLYNPIQSRVGIHAIFYVQNNRKDVDNMYTTLQDILQKGGIIENDRSVKKFAVELKPLNGRQASVVVNLSIL